MSSILHQIRGHTRDIGFPVKRLLPAMEARTVGPFVFFDHMGPVSFAAGTSEGDVRPHPHIGLATVTYLFSGAMMHRDSLGSVQRITPGDVNWMAAGSGIVHSERVPDDIRTQGTIVQGLQMWVALPQDQEEMAPAFWHYPAAELPVAEFPGVRLHLLAGSAYGKTSPVHTHSPTLYAAAHLQAGASLQVEADAAERAVYVVNGAVAVDGEELAAGTLAVLQPGVAVMAVAVQDSVMMILGGAPLDGKRFLYWNFVSSNQDRIETAKYAWASQQAERFPPVPGETEFIPLPER
jgi:redox-sensitive bicupin YhaK (pirin superfamily)